jgi:hypothetical protein
MPAVARATSTGDLVFETHREFEVMACHGTEVSSGSRHGYVTALRTNVIVNRHLVQVVENQLARKKNQLDVKK